MRAIAVLSELKLFIEINNGGLNATVKGVIASLKPRNGMYPEPGFDDYIFNLKGEYAGAVDSEIYPGYSSIGLNYTNLNELEFALHKYDFFDLAEKKFFEMNKLEIKEHDFNIF